MNLQNYRRIFFNLIVILTCWKPIFSRNLQTDDINDQLLSTIKSYMYTKADPCQEFFWYACDNWKPLRDYGIVDSISNVDYSYNQQLIQIIEDAAKYSQFETNEVFRKVRVAYKSCKTQVDYNATRYLDIIKPTDKDDWPEDGEPWKPQEKWNIWSTMGRLAAYGFSDPFLSIDLIHWSDGLYHPVMSPSKFGQRDVRYFRKSNWDTLGENVFDFAAKLSRKVDKLSSQNRDEPVQLKMTITELQHEVEHFDFVAYFSSFLGHDDVGNITVTITDIKYFREVAESVQATSRDVLIHTIKISLVMYFEKQTPFPTWQRDCMHKIRQLVPLAVDYMYDQAVYTHEREKTDAVIEKVFQTMQNKFVTIIGEHADELSAQEIASLKEKMLKMKLIIGNLPQGVDDQFYVDYFHSWEVMEDDFYHNQLSALKWSNLNSFKLMIMKEFSPLSTTYHLHSMATPFYLFTTNVVGIPHAYIRFPMIDPEFHELFLYAELGNSLGHEMMHGFDTNGVKYNAEGKPWELSVYDKPKFMESLECLKLERTNSITEKLADFSGFRLAYDTYFQQPDIVKFSGESELSNKQLFFIKFAQLFCGGIYGDPTHDTSAKRVPQVVANNPDFEEVFSCPKKTDEPVMKKCQVW